MLIKTLRGFTLVELLVVMSIIALLTSILLVALSSVETNARNVTKESDIQQYIEALDVYYSQNGAWPLPAADAEKFCLGNSYPGGVCHWANGTLLTENATLNNALAPYIPSLPSDTKGVTLKPANGGYYNGYIYDPQHLCNPTPNCGNLPQLFWFLEGENTPCGNGGTQVWFDVNDPGGTYCMVYVK